jgi:hypothetical protein
VAELEGPRGDVQVLAELRPIDQVSRGGEAVVLIPSPDVRKVGFLLALPPTDEHPGYRVDVQGPSGEVLARDLKVHPDRHRAFLVQLPSEGLTAGPLRLTLFGEGPGGRLPLAEYSVILAR